MYRTKIEFHKRIFRGEMPILMCLIYTDFGYRLYSEKEHSNPADVATNLSVDGLLECSGRIISFGNLERTIQVKTKDVLGSLMQRQLQHVSITFQNQDKHFSALLAKEPFLTKDLSLYLGYENITGSSNSFGESLNFFKGMISNIEMGPEMTITADEQ